MKPWVPIRKYAVVHCNTLQIDDETKKTLILEYYLFLAEH